MTKSTSWIIGIALCALALGQAGLTYRSPRTNPNLIINGAEGFIIPNKNFQLSGGVSIENKADKVTLSAKSVTGDLVKEGNQNIADHVRLKGGVVAKQAQEKGLLTLSGNEADYDLSGSENASVKVRGDVKIVFKGTQTGVADWSSSAWSATATLKRKAKKDENALVSASITGPLTYSGTSLSDKGTTKFSAKADQMSISKLGDGYEVKLTGNLEFNQSGPGDDESGEVTGAKTAYLELNEKNEVVRIRFSSENTGKIQTIKRKRGGTAR